MEKIGCGKRLHSNTDQVCTWDRPCLSCIVAKANYIEFEQHWAAICDRNLNGLPVRVIPMDEPWAEDITALLSKSKPCYVVPQFWMLYA